MTWTCLNSEERLAEFLEGQLAAADHAQMTAHLAECAACRELATQVRWISTRLPQIEQEMVPSGLIYRIIEATSGTEGLGGRTQAERWKTVLAGLVSPRFALGLGTVAATIFILFQALGINPKRITADDFNPVNLYRAADQQAHLTYAHGVRFFNDLRVVYEIRSRLQSTQEASTTPPPAQETPKSPSSPQSEHKLKNDLLRHGSTLVAVVSLAAPAAPGRMGGSL